MVLGYSLQSAVSTHIKGKKSYSCMKIGKNFEILERIYLYKLVKFLILSLFFKAFHPIHISGPNFSDRFSIDFRDTEK